MLRDDHCLNGALPCSEDAEKGVLCSLILAPGKVAPKCLTRITPAAFYVPPHAAIYEILLEWQKPAEQIDFLWLAQTLRDRGQFEEIGGDEDDRGKHFLNELYGFVPMPENVDYYIDGVHEAWARRAAITEANARIAAAQDRDAGPEKWDPDGKLSRGLGTRKLTGTSFLEFSQLPIDDSKTLLGDRYLCRGGGMFIVAPSGHGKSVLAAQGSIELGCGLHAFGIKPARPIRSLLIQSEDDDGDVIEMAQIVKHLKLSADQRRLVADNTHVEFVNDVTEDEFLRICDGFLAQRKFDLLWINPYTAYLGADIKDDGANTHFLRNGLTPLLTKHDCAAIILHHTPKTNFRNTEEWKASDWMYAGAGAAVLTNWARAVLVIDPCKNGVYKFIAAKRGKRIGWGYEFPVFETYWSHSREEGKLLWLTANQDEIESAKPKGQSGPEDLLPLIPLADPIGQERQFFEAKEQKKFGVNKVRDFVKILIDEGKVKAQPLKRQGVKSGVGYIRTADQSS